MDLFPPDIFFEMTSELLAKIDQRKNLVFIGPRWESNLGLSLDQLNSGGEGHLKKDIKFIKTSLIDKFSDPDKKTYTHIYPFVNREGNFTLLEWKCSLFENQIFCVINDVTEIKTLKEKMDQRNQNEEVLLKVICHDLSNSLVIIMSSLKMMKKLNEENSQKFKKYFAKIEKATRNVTDVLDSVKEVQAIESGKKEVKLAPIDLSQSLENLTFTFQERSDAKKIKLELKNELPKEKTFLADPISFNTSVLNNLVSNAIKFSKEGDRVSVKLALSENSDFVEITVRDQGIGIPDEIRENLFRTDVKTSRKGTSGEEGTGFGMPIVKSFVDKFGGKIEVESWPQDLFPDKHGTLLKISLKSTDF